MREKDLKRLKRKYPSTLRKPEDTFDVIGELVDKNGNTVNLINHAYGLFYSYIGVTSSYNRTFELVSWVSVPRAKYVHKIFQEVQQ